MTYRLGAEVWPRWLTLIEARGNLPAVEVLFAKPNRSMRRRAQRAGQQTIGEIEEDAELDILEIADAGDAYSAELIRLGALDWRGIGNAQGEPIPLTPEAMAEFLADDDLLDAADRVYVRPAVAASMEKNGLSVSLSGTGAVAMPAGDTASLPAAAASAAKSAPTPNMNRRARRAKKSGKSCGDAADS